MSYKDASDIIRINIYDEDEGQAYTYGEHRDWLMRAGFTDIDPGHSDGRI
jgi:hypothetical protein